MTTDSESLPPGQRQRSEMPRFGMTTYANRFPAQPHDVEIKIGGNVAQEIALRHELQSLPRISQVSSFHCVTTWSVTELAWSGYRFRDFFEQLCVPLAAPETNATFVVLRGQDGYKTSLPLEDLLQDDVMLADELNGSPLSVAHGAPLRLVAPRHYGYKSAKHLSSVQFWCNEFHFRPWYLRWMVHRRGRVALEERGLGLPGWVLRYLYRPLIKPTQRTFARELEKYNRHDLQ